MVERQIVVLVVAGSIPVLLPVSMLSKLLRPPVLHLGSVFGRHGGGLTPLAFFINRKETNENR